MKIVLKGFLIFILVVVFLVVAVFAVVLFRLPTTIRSEERHLEVLEKRLRKYYIESDQFDGKYTDLEVYPIYNENEELTDILVELEPYGFVIVNLIDIDSLYHSFYAVNWEQELIDAAEPWSRYRLALDGGSPTPYNGITWLRQSVGVIEYQPQDNMCFEVDENRELVSFNVSPYKAYGTLEEKLYLVSGFIPAVKRGERFFNLISLEEFDVIETVYAEDGSSIVQDGSYRMWKNQSHFITKPFHGSTMYYYTIR